MDNCEKLAREQTSKALLNNDEEAYNKAVEKKKVRCQQKTLINNLTEKITEIDNLKNRITKLENLLNQNMQ